MSNEVMVRLRQSLRKEAKTNLLDVFGTKQSNPEEEGIANIKLEAANLIAPPIDPFKLAAIVESSGTLGACVEVMVDNVDGFGHELQYRGLKGDLTKESVILEREGIRSFFKRVNESQSFTKLRKQLRRDYETYGNSFMEVIRYFNGDIATLYRADAKYMRLQRKQTESIVIEVPFVRNGKVIKTKINKKFRRFAMLSAFGAVQIKWFKEYGDPRKMCAVSGKYENELKDKEVIIEPASEILHFKQGNSVYGLPKWLGVSSVVLGVKDADYVNYGLFGNQAIPPLAILVSGGRLTQESVEDLINILESRKGVENFHKIAILEAVSSEGDIDDASSRAKIDFKPLPQQDDILFGNFIDKSEKRIRAKFRIPALYLGLGEEFSRSTSQNIKMIAEEQCFRPERNDFDEVINFTIMYDLGASHWKFRSVGPKLVEGSEAIDAIGKFARAGSLTINQAIKIMNRVLDLDAPLIDKTWADYPAAMILKLSEKGWLKDQEEIKDMNTKNLIDVMTEEE